jgi:mono/diheme cytochrome c family protein
VIGALGRGGRPTATGSARRTGGRLAALATILVGAGACASSGSAPSVPPDDAVLAVGRRVWTGECARCHGPAGKGGAGPRLADRMVDKFPDPAVEAALIAEGRAGMPPFSSRLSPEEIEAVVRYTREVL